ncbi:MAG TPA: hypothetical protein PKE45_03485 [Caldilineaceae bacterium]|nr:hypothetical protein [Caldilineaceae bacterium]
MQETNSTVAGGFDFSGVEQMIEAVVAQLVGQLEASLLREASNVMSDGWRGEKLFPCVSADSIRENTSTISCITYHVSLITHHYYSVH